MKNQNIFKRYEIKYLITKQQQLSLLKVMEDYMNEDEHGQSTICNIYYDTSNCLLIRRSIEKPLYKEKLRVRSYGVTSNNSTVFVELKKKYDSIVYKRRVAMNEELATNYLESSSILKNKSQITKEIDYFKSSYTNLIPKVHISYARTAYFAKDDHDFRITFDENILWRDFDLSLCSGVYGASLLKSDMVLMEVKTSFSILLWLVSFLSDNKIYKTSFSKYGNAYKSSILSKGALAHAN